MQISLFCLKVNFQIEIVTAVLFWHYLAADFSVWRSKQFQVKTPNTAERQYPLIQFFRLGNFNAKTWLRETKYRKILSSIFLLSNNSKIDFNSCWSHFWRNFAYKEKLMNISRLTNDLRHERQRNRRKEM